MQVVVRKTDDPSQDWTHRIRSLVIDDRDGDPDCLVLIIHDASAQIEAEERFERAFRANPAPALICRLSDLRFIKSERGVPTAHGLPARGGSRPLDLRDGRAGERGAPRICAPAPACRRDDHPDGGQPHGAERPWRSACRRGRPADRDRRRALHAVHLRGSRAAPEGRDGPARLRGALRQGLPPRAGADRDPQRGRRARRRGQRRLPGVLRIPDPGRGRPVHGGPAPLGRRRGERERFRRRCPGPVPCRATRRSSARRTVPQSPA